MRMDLIFWKFNLKHSLKLEKSGSNNHSYDLNSYYRAEIRSKRYFNLSSLPNERLKRISASMKPPSKENWGTGLCKWDRFHDQLTSWCFLIGPGHPKSFGGFLYIRFLRLALFFWIATMKIFITPQNEYF